MSKNHSICTTSVQMLAQCAGLFDHPPWKVQVSMQARRQESEAVMFTCVKDLLHKCKTGPSEVCGPPDLLCQSSSCSPQSPQHAIPSVTSPTGCRQKQRLLQPHW